MNILSKIKKLNHLTPNEESLIKFILNDIEHFVHLKPKEIASESYVSISSLYRLMDKLGLSGLHQFKLELISTLQDKTQDNKSININFPIIEEDDPHQIIQNLRRLDQLSLDETMYLFDEEHLLEMVQKMCEASTINIYTSSSNIYFAKNFQFQMQEIGKLVQVPEENYFQRITAANSDESHFSIIMSFGGRGQTTLEVIQILEDKGQAFCLIGSSENKKWIEKARYNITIPNLEDHYNKMSSFSTRLSLLYIFDVLYAMIFNQNYDENLAYKLNNYRRINKNEN